MWLNEERNWNHCFCQTGVFFKRLPGASRSSPSSFLSKRNQIYCRVQGWWADILQLSYSRFQDSLSVSRWLSILTMSLSSLLENFLQEAPEVTKLMPVLIVRNSYFFTVTGATVWVGAWQDRGQQCLITCLEEHLRLTRKPRYRSKY